MDFDSAAFQADHLLDAKASLTTTESGDLIIEGLAADWGIDDQDEMFEPGAFEKGVSEFLEKNPILAYHHDPGKALGQVLDLRSDSDGLWLKARIDKPAPGSWAEDVFNKVKKGTIRGLSVAGMFRRRMGGDGVPRIHEAKLREISVTPLPVNPRTLFTVAQKAFADAPDTLEDQQALAMLEAQADAVATVLDEIAERVR